MVRRKALTGFLFLLILTLPSCHIARYFFLNFADLNDYKKFPAVAVDNGPVNFVFKRPVQETAIQIPGLSGHNKVERNLDDFLEKNNTVAFMIVRHDTVLYERYFSGYDSTRLIPSFSVAKSFVSALIGIAIDEGYLKSVQQPVTDYLPDLKDRGFGKVRILDLLNMRAGIKWKESYSSPFALMSKYYYGTNLRRYTRNIRTAFPADSVYDYQSINTFLLGLILEKATGKPLNQYLEEKIWKPLGMESEASWSIDSKKHQAVKAFCCLNAKTHDFARFGRLYLQWGSWNGQQIISPSWIAQTCSDSNDSRDSGGHPYQYHWRVNPDGSMFAKGVLGQYVYLDPARDVIIVRFGKSAGKVNWPVLFNRLSHNL